MLSPDREMAEMRIRGAKRAGIQEGLEIYKEISVSLPSDLSTFSLDPLNPGILESFLPFK
jgi:hypothetical protein